MAPFRHDNLESILSLERLDTYLKAARGDRKVALDLYALNTLTSEALYVPLQMLEVTLRNRFHDALSGVFGSEWYDNAGVITDVIQRRAIQEAKRDLAHDKKRITPGRVVAELTFGFWTSCLGRHYEERLWRPALRNAFPYSSQGLRRNDVNRILTPVRLLRNRIAHHEPILARNIPKHLNSTQCLLGWMSPSALAWSKAYNRFNQVYDSDFAALMRQ